MTKRNIPIVFIREMPDDKTAEAVKRNLLNLGKLPVIMVDRPEILEPFDATTFAPVDLIELPAAHSCVACKSEITEGVYHGCGKLGG